MPSIEPGHNPYTLDTLAKAREESHARFYARYDIANPASVADLPRGLPLPGTGSGDEWLYDVSYQVGAVGENRAVTARRVGGFVQIETHTLDTATGKSLRAEKVSLSLIGADDLARLLLRITDER